MAIASRVSKRALSTLAAAKLPEAVAAAEPLPPAAPAPCERAGGRVLRFEDTGRLFAGEPTSALVRTLAALQALSVGPLVDAATAALRSPAVAGSALGRAAARATAYRHFCAGETADEAAAVVRRLWRGGMGGILDYGIEDAEDGHACDRNAAGFIAAVDVAASLPPGSVSRRRRRRLLFRSFLFFSAACVAGGREHATSDGIFGAVCRLREWTPGFRGNLLVVDSLVNRPLV